MKITSITVTYAISGKEEEARILSLLPSHVQRGIVDVGEEKGTEAAGYSPSCDRTKAAYEAIGKCGRLRLLRPEVLETWAKAYPDVDLASEIHKCEAWAQSKSVTRTARGWQKSLNFWLSKAQDKTRGGMPRQVVSKSVVVPEIETLDWAQEAD